MKVCLVSAPTANDFDNIEIAESEAVRMIAEHAPLGILSLAAVLEQRQIELEVIDLNRLYYECLRSEEYRNGKIDFCRYAGKYFESKSFDVYGFSTICSSYPLTLRVAREVKHTHPDAVMTLGGPQASVVDVQTLKAFPFVDFIVRGEGENTFPLLLEALDAGRGPSAVPGVTFRGGNEVIRTTNAEIISDLDSLPFPAFDLYPYIKACQYIPLELGRGCPFGCTFCSTNDFFRRRFRLKTPKHMIEEMRRVHQTYGISHFDLVHDMFTVDRKRVVGFCEELLSSGEKFYWGCSARTDCIDEDLIALMAKAGCRGIFFGIETGSARMQKIIAKRLDLDESIRNIRCADKHKIKTAVSLITGFPEENMEDLRDTVDFFLSSMRYDYADPQLCLLAPLAETPIQASHREELIFDDIISDMSFQGWKQDDFDREMIAEHPDIFPNFYSVPTPHLDRHYIKELREFVLNAMPNCRWLLAGLHQDSGDVLQVFDSWRKWHPENKVPFADGNVTRYYASVEFRKDFLQFVQMHYIPEEAKAPLALSALAEYQKTFDTSHLDQSQTPSGCDGKECAPVSGPISRDDKPTLVRGATLITLDVDYRKIVQCLRRKGRLERVPERRVTLLARGSLEQRTEILQLSDSSARLLSLCDGKKTAKEIVGLFDMGDENVAGVSADQACRLGLELLRQQHLIEVRPDSANAKSNQTVAAALPALAGRAAQSELSAARS